MISCYKIFIEEIKPHPSGEGSSMTLVYQQVVDRLDVSHLAAAISGAVHDQEQDRQADLRASRAATDD